jgi:hypothetical protein
MICNVDFSFARMLTSFVCEIYSHGLGVGIGRLKVEWGLWLLHGLGARPPC